MDKEKRIYSLTMAAYLLHEGYEDYEIKKDEVCLDKCYFVFPDTQDVQDIIDEYKHTETIYVNLKKYNAAYKEIRRSIYNKRMEENING